MRLSSVKSACVVLVIAILLWSASAGDVTAAEEMAYRLKWLFNASVAGDLYADVHGYFARQGLEVTVKEGGPERDAIRELELGRAQFGVASADQVIRALSKGARVVVIAQLFQINPLQWIYRPEAMTIERLEDLKGKTLGVTFGGNDEAILRALLAKARLTEQDVSLFSVRPNDFLPFYTRKVNFWPVYRNTQAVFLGAKLQAAGERFAFFNPAEHGVRFVANSVVTSSEMAAKQPETVRKFTVALLQGWQAAMQPANAEKTIVMLQRFRKEPRETVEEQLNLTRALIVPDPAVAVGWIDVEGWKQTERIMLDQKLIPKPVEVEKVLRQIPEY